MIRHCVAFSSRLYENMDSLNIKINYLSFWVSYILYFVSVCLGQNVENVNSEMFQAVIMNLESFRGQFRDYTLAQEGIISELKSSISELQSKVSELESSTDTANTIADIKDRLTNVENYEHSINAIGERLDVMNATLRSTIGQISSTDTVLDSVNNRLQSIESKLDILENDFNTSNTKLAAVDNRTTLTENNIGNLDSKLQSVETNIQKLDSRVQTTEDTLQTAIDSIGSVENATEALNSGLLSTKSDIEAMETLHNATEAKLEAIDNRLKSVENTVESVNTKVETNELAVQAINSRMDLTNASVSSINVTLQDLIRYNETLTERINVTHVLAESNEDLVCTLEERVDKLETIVNSTKIDMSLLDVATTEKLNLHTSLINETKVAVQLNQVLISDINGTVELDAAITRTSMQEMDERIKQLEKVTATSYSFFVMDSTTESQYSVTQAPGEVLKFDTIKSAFGEGYNATEGKYVIPVSGNYVFTFGVVVIEGTVSIKLKGTDGVILEQNGKSVGGSLEVVTGTVVISRAAGTEVYIHTERLSSTGLILIDKCWFAGWLINVSDTDAGP